MGTLTDTRLGEISLGADGYGEVFLRAGRWTLRVTVEWSGAATADLLGEDLEPLLERVLGWAVEPGHETVDLYLEHHLGEFEPEELEAILGGSDTEEGAKRGVAALRAALQPIAMHVGRRPGGGRQLAVDIGFGQDVTEVVLVVEVDPGGQPVSVDAET